MENLPKNHILFELEPGVSWGAVATQVMDFLEVRRWEGHIKRGQARAVYVVITEPVELSLGDLAGFREAVEAFMTDELEGQP